MSFSRVKPGTWAVNEELTSAQMNSLDIDHARAVDKAGDTLTGVISANGFGKVSADIHDSIVSSVDSGISTTVARGISINNDTGLSLEGSTSWPSFRITRSYKRIIPPVMTSISTSAGWTQDGFVLTGPGTVTNAILFELLPHHGSTLTTLDVVFYVGATHTGVPTTLPKVEVLRTQDLSTVGVAPTSVLSLSSTAAASFPTPASGAAWYSSGNLQKWTFTADQNNVTDRTKYRYLISLFDEGGSNSHPGNVYLGFIANFTAIANMQFA